jgi:SAM-dependent methyltransferase
MRGIVIASCLMIAIAVPGSGQSPGETLRPTDDQLRLSAIEVARLVKLLDLKPGMTVADVGAGLGAWTLQFSRWTGPSGRVWATDIDDVALRSLRALVAQDQLPNVTIVEGTLAATNLPAECCDAILLRNVYHYVPDPTAMVRSLAESLRPDGRLAIVDFPPRPNSKVPPGVPANRGGNGIPPEIVEREIGVLLKHVTTIPAWAPENVPPPGVAQTFAPSYVAIFRKGA